MDTNIIINGVVIQREWVEAIERRMQAGAFEVTAIADAAIGAGCPTLGGLDVDLSCRSINTWVASGKIRRVLPDLYAMATPAKTEAHNRKMKGGVA